MGEKTPLPPVKRPEDNGGGQQVDEQRTHIPGASDHRIREHRLGQTAADGAEVNHDVRKDSQRRADPKYETEISPAGGRPTEHADSDADR